MDAETVRFIDEAYGKAMEDTDLLTKEDLVRMLLLDPDSDECAYLGSKARGIARVKAKNKANISTAFGIDYQPCAASCRYCSFGSEWGLISGQYFMPDETIIALIRDRIAHGYRKFTLRTTEYYDIDRLCELGRRIRKEVGGDYLLSANTGELDAEQCAALKSAGFNSAYHTLHLGEGKDTRFDPETRVATMRAIEASELNLTVGIDPLGIEHTAEEIADRIMFLRTFDIKSMCSMKRINPKGTPVEDLEEVSDRRVAQVAAVIRFATDGMVSAVPITRLAMDWGANGASIGTGANPRDDTHDIHDIGTWRYDHDAVRLMFRDAGYDIDIPDHAECPICRKEPVPRPRHLGMCSVCGKDADIVSECPDGHALCRDCIEPVIKSEIKRICLASDSKDPYDILERLLEVPIVADRLVKYHIAIPAALATAYNNSSGRGMDMSAVLDEVMRRGDYVPPKACGHWGTCGAGVSCGIFYSVVAGVQPLSGEPYGHLHELTGGCLTDIGKVGGPRCCNRNTLLSMKRTVDFIREHAGVEMEWHDRVCTHQDLNRQCMGKRCPFNPEHCG
ncbi:MAG: DUF5714 domain-containing protein [Candidatus Methanomethylophilaceae archaeon]